MALVDRVVQPYDKSKYNYNAGNILNYDLFTNTFIELWRIFWNWD